MILELEIRNLIHVWLLAMASLSYCGLISSRFPKGKLRLISLLPVLIVFAILPLLTTSAIFTAITCFFFTWLATFKLLLFAFDQGPIAPNPPKSLPVFIALAALPFAIKPRNGVVKSKTKTLPLYLSTEIPLLAVLVQILFNYRDFLHPRLLLFGNISLAFLIVDIVVETSSLIVRALSGIDLDPASDEPYLSTSLRQFWGRRWNLAFTSLMRRTVYKQVRQVSTLVVGTEWAAKSAVLVSFAVSGLMHELLFWYTIRRPPSWEMTMFFVVQGLGTVVEFGIKVVLTEKKWPVPSYVRTPVAVGFVAVTSSWLFFPPLVRNGVDVRMVGELRLVGETVIEKLIGIWAQFGPHLTRMQTSI